MNLFYHVMFVVKFGKEKMLINGIFFAGVLVCRHHPGAENWYSGALEMIEDS
jgi:hypothetical protein